MAIYNYRNAPLDTELWACAYDTNNTEKSMATKREPVLGKLINDGEYYGYATFYELKRNGQIKKTGKVASYSRYYADTFEECVELYNSLIDKQIEKLEQLMTNHKQNKLEVIGLIRKDY